MEVSRILAHYLVYSETHSEQREERELEIWVGKEGSIIFKHHKLDRKLLNCLKKLCTVSLAAIIHAYFTQ